MPELTVASFNIHWGRGLRWLGYRPFDVVEACARLDADVLVLQESWAPDGDEAQHDAVARALGYAVVAEPLARAALDPHPRVVARAGAGRAVGTGDWCLAVLTRLPVLSSKVTTLPQLRLDPATRAVVRVDVAVGGARLAVHGTHLAHLEMGALLQRRAVRGALAGSDEAAVLLGDMNMWGWCISALAPPGWRRAGGGRTFPSPYPHSRIDHLLTTAAGTVRSSEVVDERGSDHRPIRSRLALPATP
jgi:endonuclease/exonuclease/phosphatase family metal-dependent hydrolase